MKRLVLGLLIELCGGCMVLLASAYAAIGWWPALDVVLARNLSGRLTGVPAALLAGGLALMLVGYAISLRAFRIGAPAIRLELGAILFAAMLLATPLMLLATMPGADIYQYAAEGGIVLVEMRAGTPDLDVQDDRPAGGEPRATARAYGPLWQVVARGIALWIGGPGVWADFVVVYKLLAAAALLAAICLVWVLLRRLAPREQARGTWLFAANPLVLVELAGSGRHTGFVAVVALLALICQFRGRSVLAVLCLGIVVALEPMAALLIPAYLVWLYAARGIRWRATRRLLAGALPLLLLAGATYGRLWGAGPPLGAGSWRSALDYTQTSLPNRVADAVALQAWAQALMDGAPDRLMALEAYTARPERLIFGPIPLPLTLLLTAVLAIWALVLFPRAREMRRLVHVWGWTWFVIVCGAALWAWPWSAVPLLALAALMPESSLAATALLLSTSALLATTLPALERLLGYSPDQTWSWVFVPPLLYATATFLGRARRRRRVIPRPAVPNGSAS